MADPDLHRRIELRLAGDDPDALRSALDGALRVRGHLDYRRTMDFAARLDEPIESLRSGTETRPDTTLELTERALKRTLKILERCDDSTGALQDRIAEFGLLHAQSAARAELDRPRFARALHKLKLRDDWDFLPLTAYWEALGERGRAAYRACVEKEYHALPPPPAGRQRPGSEEWYRAFPVLRRREELAHCESDCDALIEIHSRDLGSGVAYQRLVDTCLDYGRDAEATRWAERGVRDHPDWPGARERLAERYRADGLVAEALDQLRRAFQARPAESLWSSLREVSGAEWPGLRAELLQELAAREAQGETEAARDVTLRVRMLSADGDPDPAVDLALQHRVSLGTLHALAESAADHRPADAARLLRRVVDHELKPTDAGGYPGIVRKMTRIRSIDDSAAVRDWIATIRQRYKARRKLMQLMDAAGL
jgi:tetratricopeptide (TPR) repeat protein